MHLEIRKAVINGRNKYDQSIYPCGAWTIWQDGKFVGWNWHWDRIWELVWKS